MKIGTGILVLVAATAASLTAQTSVTAADYARAERFLGAGLNGLVIGGTVVPNWLPNDRNDRFWYRSVTANGTQIMMVDPVRRTRTPVAAVVVGGAAEAAGARWRRNPSHCSSRPMASGAPSSATGICGFATSLPARKSR